jgi:hypothetical protein
MVKFYVTKVAMLYGHNNSIRKEQAMKEEGKHREIVFFVDKEQFKTELTELTVRQILEDFAKEDPNETTLALKHGNERQKYTDLSFSITLANGMQFIVFHEGPTTVS